MIFFAIDINRGVNEVHKDKAALRACFVFVISFADYTGYIFVNGVNTAVDRVDTAADCTTDYRNIPVR